MAQEARSPIRPDSRQLDQLARRDPALGEAMLRVAPYPGFPTGDMARWSHFASLARSVTYQQLAGAAARTIHDRACALTPGPDFPTAGECLGISDGAFRGAGLSKAKIRAIKDLAQRVLDGRIQLDRVGEMDDAEVTTMLTSVWGIGEWTAQMFLLFHLGRLDVMPAGDLGVREGLRVLDRLEERPAADAVLTRAQRWRPLCSVATWVLYRLADEARA